MTVSNPFAIGSIINGMRVERWNPSESLTTPLHWRKPRMVFVCWQADLFHESWTFSFIYRALAIMAFCPHHTFVVMTHRPERMEECFEGQPDNHAMNDIFTSARGILGDRETLRRCDGIESWSSSGLAAPNIWLGTIAWDQPTLDSRVTYLLRCLSAVRFISAEPLLGPVRMPTYVTGTGTGCVKIGYKHRIHGTGGIGIDWVITGGESGPRARPCNVDWIRSIVQQCKAADVPVFVKQLGARPYLGDWARQDGPLRCPGCNDVVWDWEQRDVGGADEGKTFCNACNREAEPLYTLLDRKGSDPSEWPADLRVREWPKVAKGSNP